jgi:NCS1 family nucleobase:cation symporter-1
VPWALGFAAYQLVNPGYLDWWVTIWDRLRSWLHFTPEPWMSASIVSFVVAGLATLAMVATRDLAGAKVPPTAEVTE